MWFEPEAKRTGATEFLGYDTEASSEGVIVALWSSDGHEVDAAELKPVRAVGIVIINQTPFYGRVRWPDGRQRR